eukprot:COSAG01_NODE_886_length_12921_cov_115.252652_15_plen_76_part_00
MMTIVNLHQRETRRSVPGPDTSSEHKKFTFQAEVVHIPHHSAHAVLHTRQICIKYSARLLNTKLRLASWWNLAIT